MIGSSANEPYPQFVWMHFNLAIANIDHEANGEFFQWSSRLECVYELVKAFVVGSVGKCNRDARCFGEGASPLNDVPALNTKLGSPFISVVLAVKLLCGHFVAVIDRALKADIARRWRRWARIEIERHSVVIRRRRFHTPSRGHVKYNCPEVSAARMPRLNSA